MVKLGEENLGGRGGPPSPATYRRYCLSPCAAIDPIETESVERNDQRAGIGLGRFSDSLRILDIIIRYALSATFFLFLYKSVKGVYDRTSQRPRVKFKRSIDVSRLG